MTHYPSLHTFSFYKTSLLGVTLILASIPFLAFPIQVLMFFMVNGHFFGALYSIWKSKKFTLLYGISLCLIAIFSFILGFKILPVTVLIFTAHILFFIHFFYDEYFLQGESPSFSNLISICTPSILYAIFLINDFYKFDMAFSEFVLLAAAFLLLELIYTKTFSWFLIYTKFLTVFLLYAIAIGESVFFVSRAFLLFHYLFWFVYPVYKLRAAKPSSALNLGVIVAVLTFVTGTVFLTKIFLIDGTITQVSIQYFQVLSMIHILTTAPFGYLFGLQKPLPYARA